MLTFNGFLKFQCLFLFRQVCEPELERKVWVKRSKELNLKTFSRNKKRKSEEKEEKSKLQKIKKVATGPSRRSDSFYLRDWNSNLIEVGMWRSLLLQLIEKKV